MRDTIIEGLAKVTADSLEIVDGINGKLARIIILQHMIYGCIICILVIGMALSYFATDYQYPSVTQDTKQDGQSVTQQIVGGK